MIHILTAAMTIAIATPTLPSGQVQGLGQNALTVASPQFALRLWAALSHDGKSNQIASPVSLAFGMGMLMNGVRGDSRADVARSLSLSDGSQIDEFNSAANRLLGEFNHDSTVTCTNALFSAPGLAINPGYQNFINRAFRAVGQGLADTGDNGVQQVNQWVSNGTKGKIPKFVSKLDPATQLLLINTINFSGLWQEPFSRSGTSKSSFKGPEGPINVPMMFLRSTNILYAADSSAQAVALPYQGGVYAMVVILPREGTPESAFSEMQSLTRRLVVNSVIVQMPKFKFSQSVALEGALSKMGMGSLFASADFSPVNPYLTRVTSATQQCTVAVDEEKTEASAATMFGGGGLGGGHSDPDPYIRFTADHPFAFAIIRRTSGDVLFMGVVHKPE